MTHDTITLSTAPHSGTHAPWTMEEMVNDTLALKALLIRENGALKSMDISTVRALHDEKLRLVRKLELQKELLTHHPALLQGVTLVQKARLQAASDGMEKVMKENFYATLKAREINQCVAQAFSREVRKHEQRATGYNRHGITARGTSPYGGGDASPSIALNQMI